MRSWDQFHDCANVAMAGCPQEAAAVWESLRQESKKMQFSGNLYDMCSNRDGLPPADSAVPRGSPGKEEVSQESLRGGAAGRGGGPGLLGLLLTAALLLISCLGCFDLFGPGLCILIFNPAVGNKPIASPVTCLVDFTLQIRQQKKPQFFVWLQPAVCVCSSSSENIGLPDY
uniref:(Atlantic silverside) hypothetical protein n=1 Tax=Menidia menidia TaxID=238744 RepID=A0A8S4BRP4_9TELE|nr:unnamed protein product [Menidia menidia]